MRTLTAATDRKTNLQPSHPKTVVLPVSINQSTNQSINQSINMFNVLGCNWDPTDGKFSCLNNRCFASDM